MVRTARIAFLTILLIFCTYGLARGKEIPGYMWNQMKQPIHVMVYHGKGLVIWKGKMKAGEKIPLALQTGVRYVVLYTDSIEKVIRTKIFELSHATTDFRIRFCCPIRREV